MDTTSFALRHIGPSSQEQKAMLNTIGVSNIEQLIYETVPNDIRLKKDLNLASAMSESPSFLPRTSPRVNETPSVPRKQTQR